MKRPVVGWALYDWANSAFATTVIAGFFPVFFKTYWSAGADPTESSFQLGLANSAGSLLVVLLAPVLGAIADETARRKRHLLAFMLLGVVMTFSLALVAQGQWLIAAVLYALGGVGFAAGNIFYDALLPRVAAPAELDRVSALGYGLGYLGGGVLFAGNVALVLAPQRFGFDDAAGAVRASFVSVAVWWALFSIPLFRWVHEAPGSPRRAHGWGVVRAGFARIGATLGAIRALRPLAIFLVAYWFYIDGVHTIIRMAVDYGLSLGFPANSLIVALLITQFVGFPAALGFGYLAGRVGVKPALYIGLAVYVGLAVWGYFMDRVAEFYALAVVVGLVQGGVQALSRSLYARMIPPERAAEFFGFYNMFGKFAAILGPALMGVVGLLTGSSRTSILAVVALFAVGGALLSLVETPRD